MKIYLLMHLNEVIGDRYFTNEEDIKKLVEEINSKQGGEFWYKTLTNNVEDYKKMAKSFIGETIQDFFCNGFFGSRTFDLTGAEITRIYRDDDGITIEVKKIDDKYEYGCFENGRDDWQYVYEYLDNWINGSKYD